MPRFGELVRELRRRVIAALHSGHLHPGERLPSVRELAGELGEDPRTILRAYRLLENEGLVEIRTRSGVYLAPREQVAPEIEWETSRWVVEHVLAEAWQRRIAIPALPDFVRRCTTTVTVRCACVDSVEDTRVSLCREIREDFGMETVPVPVPANGGAGDPLRLKSVQRAIRGVDLIVTSGFHASELRQAADDLGKPLVIMTLNAFARDEIERLKRRGPLTFVVLDPGFEERLHLVFGSDVRVILAEDRDSLEQLDPEKAVVLSRAAAERLGDDARPTLKAPVISIGTARELAHWLVHFNLQALRSGSAEE